MDDSIYDRCLYFQFFKCGGRQTATGRERGTWKKPLYRMWADTGPAGTDPLCKLSGFEGKV